ncbi:MAG: YdcH family protein [Lysobacterales bacterium]
MTQFKNDSGETVLLIAQLREEHRDLDEAIARLSEHPSADQLRLTRLKKRKLKLKDWIAHLESQLIPDLDA